MESILALAISAWLLYRLFRPKPKRQARQAPKATTGTNTTLAQWELLESLQSRIDGLQDEYDRLNAECEIAVDTKNTKRLEKNAKRIDVLTEQIARKKLQAAKLQDQLTKTL